MLMRDCVLLKVEALGEIELATKLLNDDIEEEVRALVKLRIQ